MERREFIAGLGIAAALPFPARAQKSALPVIGFLGAPSRGSYVQNVAAIHQGLKEAGYIEGINLTIEYRWRMVNMRGCRPWRLSWLKRRW